MSTTTTPDSSASISPDPKFTSKGSSRRAKIARAGAHVLRAKGIDGLTHRAVAEVAAVPLGSTSYYFKSRDDLLEAAVEYTTKRNSAWLKNWAKEHSGDDLAESLSQLLYEYLTQRRYAATFDLEVYLIASRRPELQPLVHTWTKSFIEDLAKIVDEAAARRAVTVFNGLLLICLSTEDPPSRESLYDQIAHAL